MTVTQESRWRAELEVIKELGRMPSTREMQKLLKEKKGMTVHHSTISEDFKKDLNYAIGLKMLQKETLLMMAQKNKNV